MHPALQAGLVCQRTFGAPDGTVVSSFTRWVTRCSDPHPIATAGESCSRMLSGDRGLSKIRRLLMKWRLVFGPVCEDFAYLPFAWNGKRFRGIIKKKGYARGTLPRRLVPARWRQIDWVSCICRDVTGIVRVEWRDRARRSTGEYVFLQVSPCVSHGGTRRFAEA